jgi:phytoene dehydrogenase-like protein
VTGYDAVIVGAGPNGLTAAARLATLGWSVCVLEAASSIGGGCRTKELGVPGVVHDICAAAHPLGVTSPAFRALDLEAHGLRWLHSEAVCAHPLDGGDAAMLYRDLDTTSAQFTTDRWTELFLPLVAHWDAVSKTLLSPLFPKPVHPLVLPHLRRCAESGQRVGQWLGDDRAAALFAGLAGHGARPLNRLLTAGVGLFLGAAGHQVGWPVAEGGSGAIIDALAAVITAHGGVIETNRPVRSHGDLPPARVTLLDTNPGQVAEITGRQVRSYDRFRHGPGSCKVDYVLSGPMPWTNRAVGDAATVHIGGTMEEILSSEQAVTGDAHAMRPYILATQPAAADPSRRTAEGEPLWAYCHVPAGSPVNTSGTIERQFDRFAPGWRDLIVSRHVTTAAQFARYNMNYVGGDVAGGSMAGLRGVLRPGPSTDPYRTPIEGFWLCSASTPPGAGVHGMGGWHAVSSVLRADRIKKRWLRNS